VEGRKTESGEVAALANLCDDTLSSEIMIVVTSRPRSVTESGLLGKPEWQHLILKGFSPQQQFEYLKSTLEHVTDVRNKEATTWEEACLAGESRPSRRTYRIISPAEELLQDDKVFGPLYLQIGELLQVPALLSFVRQLAQRTGKFPRFANRADLYWQAVNEFWKRENTKAEALNPSQMQLLQQFPRYRRLLAAVAYQMLVDHPGEYTIEGHSAVNKLKREARLGCQRDKNSDSDSFIAPNEWDRLWDEVDDVAVLTRHLMVEQANEGLFGFKHRGMQEFFAGLYLANMYSATDDQQHLLPLIGQEAGFWPLRFAAELQVATNVDARAWPQPAVCHAALDLAFNPDTTPRPNELRWHLLRIALEQNSTKYQEWRDRLHQPFRSLLMEGPIDHAQTAAELLPVEELQRVASVWGISPERLQQLLPDDPAAPTWVCCPPRSVEGVPANLKERQQQWLKSRQLAGSPDRYWFWQGTAELVGIYSDEQPRHKVAVRRFWMQATTVTLAQYRLFDSQRIQDDAEAFQDYAKTEDCPVITVNWYDAALFACWVGDKCRLPSESEWEFACRAGFDGDQDLFSLASGGSKSLDGSQANFNGKHPYKTGKTAKNFFYVEQTLPVRWTAETRQTWQHHSDKQTPPAFGPNMWGLWQMHGNVWEWCADVFRIDEYATRYNPDTGSKQKVGDNTPGFYSAPPTEGLMYTVGPSRVLRGGSWDDDGGYLRCAFRLDFTPVFRNHLIGFRLCWGE
jgi:formylglycine-generating enzyme required for sulfatase activity